MIASRRSSSRQQKRLGFGAREVHKQPASKDSGLSAASRYDVLERCGEGTLFVVYRVRDKETHAICALKALKGVYSRHEDFSPAVVQAARAAAALRHPHLASVHEVGREEDTVFLVEEWLPSGTLEKRLRRAPFGRIETTSLAVHLLEALTALHESGINHGDVRPRQILFDAEGVAKLNDSGYSSAYQSAGMNIIDVQVEAVHYLAPERWDGHDASVSSDLYALGVVLYRITTGRVPFDGTSPLSIGMRHRNDFPLRPRQFNPDCPPELEEFILQLLEKEPEARFASAREALQVLAPEHQPTPVQHIRPPAVAAADLAPEPSVEEVPQTVELTPIEMAESGPVPVPANGAAAQVIPAAATVAGAALPGELAAASTPISTPPQSPPRQAQPKPFKQVELLSVDELDPSRDDDKFSEKEQLHQARIDKRRRGRREMLGAFLALFWTFVALSLLVGIGAGAYYFWIGEAPPDVKVPKYVGLNQSDAERLLANTGLKMRIGKEVYNPKKPEGTVLSGDKDPGTVVKKGRMILVTISRGEEPVRMVDFSELSLAQARAITSRHGMRLGHVAEQFHNKIPKGFICGQFPEPGETFRRSEPINLVVSRGPQPSSVAPDPAALPVAPTAPRLPDEEPAPRPPQQSGAAVESDETLISRGAIVSVALPADGGPQEVKIVVRDAEGEYTAYEQTHDAGEVIDKAIQVVRPQGSTALVRVYIGGRLLREIRV